MHCLSQVVYTKNTVGAQEARRFSCSAHTQNVYILFNGISKAESLIFWLLKHDCSVLGFLWQSAVSMRQDAKRSKNETDGRFMSFFWGGWKAMDGHGQMTKGARSWPRTFVLTKFSLPCHHSLSGTMPEPRQAPLPYHLHSPATTTRITTTSITPSSTNNIQQHPTTALRRRLSPPRQSFQSPPRYNTCQCLVVHSVGCFGSNALRSSRNTMLARCGHVRKTNRRPHVCKALGYWGKNSAIKSKACVKAKWTAMSQAVYAMANQRKLVGCQNQGLNHALQNWS